MLTRHRARYIATAAHQLPRQQAIRLRDSAHSLGLERFKRWFVCAPAIPGLLTASSSSSKSSSAYAPVLSSRPPRRPRRPPSVQSPFAQLGCYLRWGDVVRLLGEHYPSFFARTGSFAAPVGLSPSSAFGLVGESLQVVTSPCCPRQLPNVIPRVCAWMLDPIPRRYTVCSHLFLPRCHRPSPWKDRVGFPLRSCERLLAGHAFEAAGIS